MKKLMVVLTAGVFFCCTVAAYAEGKAHWGYSGEAGPEKWGTLCESFRMCAEGRNQSPVNLAGVVEAELAPLAIFYQAAATEILNNGHTVQVNVAPGSTLVVDGITFNLLQFHFHAPSENLIENRPFPLEAHLVHADRDGNLAVVAVMFTEGAASPLIDALWKQMPATEGDKHALAAGLNAVDLLPAGREYYRFSGSLTTPPCTEGVRWLVLKDPVSVSAAQVKAFEHVMHHPNNRPVQPLNARKVLK